MAIRAVLFDLGGVVFDSPFAALTALEARSGLPQGAVNSVIVGSGPGGAWARNERGELEPEAFRRAFDAELSDAGLDLRAADVMGAVSAAFRIRPAMVAAVSRLRDRGIRTAAVTNNWRIEGGTTLGAEVREYFDAFVESAVEGIHKPDPRMYLLALDRLGVEGHEAAFLDDIGRNLKSAAALGITTIKVEAVDRALADLESVVGFGLRGHG